MSATPQPGLFHQEQDRSLIDQLLLDTRRYRSTSQYAELLRFVRRLPHLAPFNAFLVHAQRPGVSYVANPRQWRDRFQRWVKPEANPLVILVPFGPVDFVYDVADTDGKAVPDKVLHPFRAEGVVPEAVWSHTLANCARDLIKVVQVKMGMRRAGSIGSPAPTDLIELTRRRRDGKEETQVIAARYRLTINSAFERPALYATIAHELAHLYCGHLGTPDERWWPNRQGMTLGSEEFEAESAAYIACSRLGIRSPSAAYLYGYMRDHSEIPDISIETVMKVAGEIERMGRVRLGLRKYERIDRTATPSTAVQRETEPRFAGQAGSDSVPRLGKAG